MKTLFTTMILLLAGCGTYHQLNDYTPCKSIDIIVKKSGTETRYNEIQVLSEEETHIVFMHTGRPILHNGEYLIICND